MFSFSMLGPLVTIDRVVFPLKTNNLNDFEKEMALFAIFFGRGDNSSSKKVNDTIKDEIVQSFQCKIRKNEYTINKSITSCRHIT